MASNVQLAFSRLAFGFLSYCYGVCRAEGYAALAVDAVFFFAANCVCFVIVVVGIVGALVNAYFAAYAPVLVPFNKILGNYVSFH